MEHKTPSPRGLPPKRVIVALDVPGADAALALAARLDPALCRVKVGKELFVAAGPAMVERLHERGFEVFLDLKFHDIPNTVAGACRSAARLGVWMLDVHASGGAAMMQAAREAIEGAARRPLLVGVTVLTSLADADMASIGWAGSALDNAVRLARLTHASGLDGVVCSAQEAQAIRAATPQEFRLVTPGIRLPSGDRGDQSRVVTPSDAIRLGADYLVVGRSITHAPDPVAALQLVIRSLQEGNAT